MLDKVEYWLNLADEDVLNAKAMINGNRFLGAGYFCHQMIEKALKAVVANVSEDTPPKIHDLRKLARQGGIYDDLSAEQLTFINSLNPLQVEARYPEYKDRIAKTLNRKKCSQILKDAEELLCWIKTKLGK